MASVPLVRKSRSTRSTTDLALLVDGLSAEEFHPWDRQRISKALQVEAGLDSVVADEIAEKVEWRILRSDIQRISTSLIRALVDNELFERGLVVSLKRQRTVGIPRHDLDQMIRQKSSENSNVPANNPEAVNLLISETTLKQYALQEIFAGPVADAHLRGEIYIHDLGYPTRLYCSSHSLEYLKKYGLQLENLDTISAPAKHARTLTGHLNTFLASMQAYYAGALGLGYLNIFYAPYLVGMSDKEMRQEAQHLIFAGSQNAFSRGGQALFLDFNVHLGVPDGLADTPAIGPGGKETGKVYKDYEEEAQRFAKALLDVWRAGDAEGNVFAFPKADVHITDTTFSDPKQLELLRYVCEVASANGSPYFIFDRDAITMAACCRLRTDVDQDDLKHPESLRFCGFQNVTINLPQAAYRAQSEGAFFADLKRLVGLAFDAHYQKREFVKELMAKPGLPLWQMGRHWLDGRPYVDLDKATYIIGLLGLNECVQCLYGKELHEEGMLEKGLNIISVMYEQCLNERAKSGLIFKLEESPAESAVRRLAKLDVANFPQAAKFVQGSIEEDTVYYTNSVHLRADAPVDLLDRIRMQAAFHHLIESGAITHAFVGEHLPPADSVFNLVKKTFFKTNTAQLTISPEFTLCQACRRTTLGMNAFCPECGSVEVEHITRIVGYYSRVKNWNPSKRGELQARQRGHYVL